ncbi:MAG: M48 family metalloprotease [Candidatus Babeliales bacterium]|nr:M48 family metalloprotease [Candidatus Babeliales bacterium]
MKKFLFLLLIAVNSNCNVDTVKTMQKIRDEYNQTLEVVKLEDPKDLWDGINVNSNYNSTLFWNIATLAKNMNVAMPNVMIYKGNAFNNKIANITGQDSRVNAGANDIANSLLLGAELIKNLNLDELNAIIAHELAHIKHKHVRQQIRSNGINGLIGISVLISTHLLARNSSFYQNHKYKILFSLNCLIGLAFDYSKSKLSRQHEIEPDNEALKYVNKDSFKSGFSKLQQMLYNTAECSWLNRNMSFATHPPLLDRCANADSK